MTQPKRGSIIPRTRAGRLLAGALFLGGITASSLNNSNGLIPNVEYHVDVPADLKRKLEGKYLHFIPPPQPEISLIESPQDSSPVSLPAIPTIVTSEDRILAAINQPGLINQPSLLYGVAKRESNLNLDIGCNAEGDCGVFQMRRSGAAGGLAAILSGDGKYHSFQDQYAVQIAQKRARICEAMPYFHDLAALTTTLQDTRQEADALYRSMDTAIRAGGTWAGRNAEFKTALEQREAAVQQKRFIDGVINLIERGYHTSDPEAQAKRASSLAEMKRDSQHYNLALTLFTSDNRDWIGFLAQQDDKMDELIDYTKNGPVEFQAQIADALLARYIQTHGLKGGLTAYNAGNPAAQTDYAARVLQFQQGYPQ